MSNTPTQDFWYPATEEKDSWWSGYTVWRAIVAIAVVLAILVFVCTWLRRRRLQKWRRHNYIDPEILGIEHTPPPLYSYHPPPSPLVIPPPAAHVAPGSSAAPPMSAMPTRPPTCLASPSPLQRPSVSAAGPGTAVQQQQPPPPPYDASKA